MQILLLYMIRWKPLPVNVKLFTSGLHTSRKWGLPLSLHCRDVWADAPQTADEPLVKYLKDGSRDCPSATLLILGVESRNDLLRDSSKPMVVPSRSSTLRRRIWNRTKNTNGQMNASRAASVLGQLGPYDERGSRIR